MTTSSRRHRRISGYDDCDDRRTWLTTLTIPSRDTTTVPCRMRTEGKGMCHQKEAICGILCLLEHENLQEGSRLSEGNNKISPHTKRSLLPVYICSDLLSVLPGLGDQTEWLLEGKLPVSCPTRWEKQQNRLLAGRNLKYVSSATTAPSWDR